jgi:hypothetical protein
VFEFSDSRLDFFVVRRRGGETDTRISGAAREEPDDMALRNGEISE